MSDYQKQIVPLKRRVHFHETDAAGVIHHANFIKWFEEARMDYLRKLKFDYLALLERGLHIIILNYSCDCKSMLRFDDEVEIFVSVKSINNVKLVVEYKVMKGDTICVIGETIHCAYDSNKNSVISFKKEIPHFYNLMLDKSAS